MTASRARAAALAATTMVASSFAASPVTPVAAAVAAVTRPAAAARNAPMAAAPAPAAPSVPPCSTVAVDLPTTLTLGKSQLIHLDFPARRVIVGGHASNFVGSPAARPETPAPAPTAAGAAPAAQGQSYSDGIADAQIVLLSPTELFFLGNKAGSMNVVLQGSDGRCLVKDIIVTMDPLTLQAKIRDVLPDERDVRVSAAETSLVLTGTVSDAVKLDQVMAIAGTYADPRRMVNLLRVNAPQQVMLEVKIAEVSKTLLDNFGLNFSRLVTSSNGAASSIISGIIGGGSGVLGRFEPNTTATLAGSAAGSVALGNGAASGSLTTTGRGGTILGLNAQKKDGIVRVLAEPNILAISGQQASFLSGGKIFIPVAQSQSNGGVVITLEEKEFGVGLKFTPTVLDGGRINLKLISEASDLSQTGSPFTSFNGATAILPSLSTRRVDTTVQLIDGQTFAVAGLIKNNLTQALNKFPGLGDVPVMGALFRSTEFNTDQTELMFLVTPHLVKPLTANVVVPTDNHVPATPADSILRGMGEGTAPPAARPQSMLTPLPAAPNLPAPAAPARVTEVAPAPQRPQTDARPQQPAVSPTEPAPNVTAVVPMPVPPTPQVRVEPVPAQVTLQPVQPQVQAQPEPVKAEAPVQPAAAQVQPEPVKAEVQAQPEPAQVQAEPVKAEVQAQPEPAQVQPEPVKAEVQAQPEPAQVQAEPAQPQAEAQPETVQSQPAEAMQSQPEPAQPQAQVQPEAQPTQVMGSQPESVQPQADTQITSEPAMPRSDAAPATEPAADQAAPATSEAQPAPVLPQSEAMAQPLPPAQDVPVAARAEANEQQQ